MYTTDLYDKRETFKFKIVNFPHMDIIKVIYPQHRHTVSSSPN